MPKNACRPRLLALMILCNIFDSQLLENFTWSLDQKGSEYVGGASLMSWGLINLFWEVDCPILNGN